MPLLDDVADPTDAGGAAPEARVLRTPKWQIGAGISLVLILASTVAWYFARDDQPTPRQQFSAALSLLDSGEEEGARELAKNLESIDYRDADFPGGIPFVLGLVAFRTAERASDSERRQISTVAVAYLREAEFRGLDLQREPEWAAALGISLYRIGRINDAMPLLELAAESETSAAGEAALLLVDGWLDPSDRTTAILDRALHLNERIVADSKPGSDLHQRGVLQRAEVLLSLGRHRDADQLLAQIPRELASTQVVRLLQARIALADRRTAEAQELLKPIAEHARLDRTHVHQALYLLGRTAEELGSRQAAIGFYERVIEGDDRGQEALAAGLRAAGLLRQDGRREEALEHYSQTLRLVRNPKEFRNRWISRDQFRELILDAWNAWIEEHAFVEAIALAEVMTPLFPLEQAYELSARAYHHWAEHVDKSLRNETAGFHAESREELLEAWRRSGQAYVRLAEAKVQSRDYPEALWTSADHFGRGHDFANALLQIDRFLEQNATKRIATALLYRGRILLNLDRLEEASQTLKRVLDEHPTDPAAFEAEFLLGRCALESDRPDEAEQVWRGILASEKLTPAANEWRLALFSLGHLLFQTAENRFAAAGRAEAEGNPADAERLYGEAFARWEEAVRRLDEFLRRYPAAGERAEARHLLAQALDRSSEEPRRRLARAETSNARQELQGHVHRQIERALEEYRSLQTSLLAREQEGRINSLEQKLLRSVFLEIANALFRLGRYDQAVSAYTGVTNRYPQDAQALSSYVQIANCYERLGRHEEARGMLEQARVLLKEIPETAFNDRSTNLSRQEWETWLEWAGRMRR